MTLTDEETAERLKLLIPSLEKYGLCLVLEVHGKDHGTGKRIGEVLDLIGSDRIRMNYDTGNAIFYGRTDVLSDMDACMDAIAYMHLKDKKGAPEQWDFPALGEGTVDFPEIIRRLEARGNDCPFSIEIEFTPEGPENLAEVNLAVERSGRYLQGIGMEL